MKIVQGIAAVDEDVVGSVLTVGTFDGIHRGHQAIIERTCERAKTLSVPCVIITFAPHPQALLTPATAPLLLTTTEERADLVREFGISAMAVLPFDEILAAMEPEAFVRDILVGTFSGREVVVGEDHRFGRGRRGDRHTLARLGRQFGFSVVAVPPVRWRGRPISSTRIRRAILAAKLREAARMLGRWYSFRGHVLRGESRGRTLDYPTANLEVKSPSVLLPPDGVYAVLARIDGGTFRGMMNIGTRPTFGSGSRTVEVHLLDFVGDIYDLTMEVQCLDRLRDEKAFDRKEDLRMQISRDELEVRRLFDRVDRQGCCHQLRG